MTETASPETAHSEDLSWVTFSESGEDDSCQWRDGCPAEAVAVAVWHRSCTHMARSTRLCARHRARVLAIAADATVSLVCSACPERFYLDRMESAR